MNMYIYLHIYIHIYGWSRLGAFSKIFPLLIFLLTIMIKLTCGEFSTGPSFSNPVLQALLVLIRLPPPPPRRMLVLATCSNAGALHELELLDVFDAVLQLAPLEAHEAAQVLRLSQLVTEEVVVAVQDMLHTHTIPIKKLLTVVDLARCDSLLGVCSPARGLQPALMRQPSPSSCFSEGIA